MTIFEKIIARQIPAKIIWEDDDAVVFRDVNPQAPVHVLIVPKKVVPRLTDATDDDRALLGKLLLVARDMAKKLELSSGYRVVINCGPGIVARASRLVFPWRQRRGVDQSLGQDPRKTVDTKRSAEGAIQSNVESRFQRSFTMQYGALGRCPRLS